jgi:hypothetical protein
MTTPLITRLEEADQGLRANHKDKPSGEGVKP